MTAGKRGVEIKDTEVRIRMTKAQKTEIMEAASYSGAPTSTWLLELALKKARSA